MLLGKTCCQIKRGRIIHGFGGGGCGRFGGTRGKHHEDACAKEEGGFHEAKRKLITGDGSQSRDENFDAHRDVLFRGVAINAACGVAEHPSEQHAGECVCGDSEIDAPAHLSGLAGGFQVADEPCALGFDGFHDDGSAVFRMALCFADHGPDKRLVAHQLGIKPLTEPLHAALEITGPLSLIVQSLLRVILDHLSDHRCEQAILVLEMAKQGDFIHASFFSYDPCGGSIEPVARENFDGGGNEALPAVGGFWFFADDWWHVSDCLHEYVSGYLHLAR